MDSVCFVSRKAFGRIVSAAVAVTALLLLSASAAAQHMIVVDTLGDDAGSATLCTAGTPYHCPTLSDAVAQASLDLGDTIDLTALQGSLFFSNSNYAGNAPVTVLGPGSNRLTITGVFAANPANPSASLTISGLTLSSSVIEGFAVLKVANVTFVGGPAPGIASLYYNSTSVISDSTFWGPGAGIQGGFPITVTNCTFVESEGIDSAATVTNSTFLGNPHAVLMSGGHLTFVNNMIVGSSDTQHPAVDVAFGTVTEHNNLFFNNAGGDYSGFIASSTDIFATDPLLPAPGFYGGPTQTVLPPPGSPAICAGASSALPAGTTTDQRGLPITGSQCASGAVTIGSVQPGYLVVNTTDDANDGSCGTTCSLRDAINTANATGGKDISFSSSLNGGTISLGSSLPQITSVANLMGPGANNLTVSGNGRYQIFSVGAGGVATIYGLTVAQGLAVSGGGAANSGILQVDNSTFYLNSGMGPLANGPGILPNPAGAIANVGTLSVTRSSFIQNSGTLVGAIYNEGSLTVSNSTFSRNNGSASPLSAGGIFNFGSALSVANSTFVLNSGAKAGCVWTISNNVAINNSIFTATPAGAFACIYSGSRISESNNLFFDNPIDFEAGGSQLSSTDLQGQNPQLQFLGNFGGPTQTFLPLPGSPAICGGNMALVPGDVFTDQRGFPRITNRPAAGKCLDLGSVQTYYQSIQFTNAGSGYTASAPNQPATPAPNISVTENGQNIGGIPITLTFTGTPSLSGFGPVITQQGAGATFTALTADSGGTDTLSATLNVSPTLTLTTNPTASFTISGPVKTPSTVTLALSSHAIIFGTPETLTATVTPSATGTVTFIADGTIFLGSVQVNNGTATLITSSFGAGSSYSIIALYSGDANYAGSSSSAQLLSVSRATPVVTQWPTASPIIYGQRVSASQLTGGTASVPGTFEWVSSSGIVTTLGSFNSVVIFIPADFADYYSVTGDVTLTVNLPTSYVVTVTADDPGTASNCTPQTTPSVGTDASCSLRDALLASAANNGGYITFDGSVFNGPKTIALSNGPLTIVTPTIIAGPTSGSVATLTNLVTVRGTPTATVLTVALGIPASISNLALGFGSSGIDNQGFLTLGYDSIIDNSGVGINNSGVLELSYSTVSGNSNSGGGGGILNNGGSLNLNFDTIAGNTAGGAGGGILLENGGTARISNTTISGNTAGSGYGGGIANDQTFPSHLSLGGTILSGNFVLKNAGDYDGPQYTDLGSNVIGVAIPPINPSILNPNPIDLAPLGNYGGPTQTMIPLAGSPALFGCGQAPTAFPDQRGIPNTSGCSFAGSTDSIITPTVTFTGAPASAGYQAKFSVTATTNGSTFATITASGACSTNGTPFDISTSSGTFVSVQIIMTSASGACSLQASWAADTHYMAATATQTTKAATIAPTVVLSLSSNSISYGVSETFTATLPSAVTGTVTFLNNGTTIIGTAPVINGTASFTTSTPLGAGSYSITAAYSGDSNYSSAISSALALTVSKAIPLVTQWPAASSITYGQPLSDSQLTGGNASVGGGFAWTLPNTVLNAGTQLASATFIPFDQTNYSSVIGSVPILVNPANFVVTVSSDDAGTASNCTPQVSSAHGTDASCSLRDALLESAAAGGGNISFDSIKFSSPTSITLTTNTILTVPNATTITGATSGSGAALQNLVAVDGNKQTTVFTVGSAVTASISNLIIQNGNGSPYAGGINNAGTLTLNTDTITQNAGYGSGAIWNSGTLTLIDSTVSGNGQGCIGCNGGGAITNVDGTLTLINDTITANFANSGGSGGIVSDSPTTFVPTVSITDSTISGDGALAGVPEIAAFGFANLITVKNSIISQNVMPAYTNGGGNVIGGSNINLAPLGNYGGPTQTMIPLPGSAAICAALQSNIPSGVTSDQRGLSNMGSYPGNTTCVDSGAVKTNYAISFTSEPPASSFVNANFTAAVTLTESGAPFLPGVKIPLSLTGNGTLSGGLVGTSSGIANYTLQVSSIGTGDQLTPNLTLNSTPAVALSTVSSKFDIQSATPTVGLSLTTPISYGTQETFTATLPASATGTVTFYNNATTALGTAPVNNGTASFTTSTPLSAGSYSVTASYSGDSNYRPATSGAQSLTVSQATPTVKASTSQTPAVYGTTLTFSASLSTAGSGSTPTGTVTFMNGTTVLTSCILANGACTATYSALKANSYSLTAAYSGDNNYAIASGGFSQITTQATPTISWPTPGAIYYGTALSSLQLDASATFNGNSIPGTYAYSPAPGTVLGAGTQKLQVTFTPTDGTDFTTAMAAVNLTVTPAPLNITASSSTINYGISVPAISAGYSGFVNGDSYISLSTQPTCVVLESNGITPFPAGTVPLVGTYTTQCSGAVDPNYSIKYTAGTLTVKIITLTITASSGTMIFGSTPPAITVASYSGFVNGDNYTSLSTQPTCMTTATNTSPVGNYASTCSGASDPNYNIVYAPGTVVVTQAPVTAKLTVSAPSPLVPTQSFQYSDPAVLTISFPGTLVGGISPGQMTTQVTFNIGTQQVATGIPVTCSGTPIVCTGTTTVNLVENPNGNGQMSPGSHNVTATIVDMNPNFYVPTAPSATVNITQEDAAVGYNGTTYFAVPSTQTTINIPVTYTIQDATATGSSNPFNIYDAYPGDITKTGPVNITLNGQYINSSGNQANFSASCNNVAVTAVTGQVGSNGLPSAANTAPCTFANVPVNGTFQITITPVAGSYYMLAAGSDTQVTVATSNGGGGFITGGGFQSAAYLKSNPSGMGAAPYGLLGNLGGKVNFGFVGKYNKSGSNLQSSANIIVRTSCMTTSTISALAISNYTPHPSNDGYCVYQIKSNKTVSMTDSPYTSACTSSKCGQPGYGALVTGANIQDVTKSTAVPLMGGGTLQLQGYDNSEPGIGNDTLSIQVTDNNGRVWFSNSWTGTKTAIYNSTLTSTPGIFAPIVNGGKVSDR